MPKAKSQPTTSRAKGVQKKPKSKAKSESNTAGSSQSAGSSQAAVDSSQWRESRVRMGTTISKGEACKQYRLKAQDLDGLTFDRRETVAAGNVVKMYLYQEREVERRAWEKHGGPEGFEAYLEKLRQRHIKKEGKYARFTQPAAYEPAGGGVYIMTLGPPPANYDPHVGKSPTLLRLKQQMPRWLWDVCHRAMDRVDDRADPYVGESGRFSRTRDREGPMRTAALRLAKSYPARPAEPVPSSPAIDHLREVLAEAPRLPVDLGLGARPNGFTITETGWPEFDYEYEWDPPYLDRLFGALIEVTESHGTGDQGWRAVRWEVYDKYSDCLDAMSYDSREDRWADQAAQWLKGKYTVGDSQDIGFSVSARSKSSFGERYNDLLPR